MTASLDRHANTPVTIVLSRCEKVFADGTRALWPLDLTIEAGETLVLLGPSGCGKTTTLRLIAGLEFCDGAGSIRFDGSDVTHVPIERRGVGMVFQHYALFPNMSVAGNIAYGLTIRGLSRSDIARRVAAMAELVHLEALLERRIDQLSGGQRQRVALARALAVEPRVLLLDEPLTALDAKLRDALRGDLAEILARLSITAVYVTHDQGEAMALGDRVAVMRDGRIEQIGAPRDIYHHPKNAFVADFVGRVNRVPGRAVATGVEVPGGSVPDPAGRFRGTTLMFRPEDATLEEGASAWMGRIAALSFQGECTLVTVEVAPQQTVLIEAPSRFALDVGASVGLRLSPTAWFADGDLDT
jgi:putative spermidine/putrescine transport system ATP-binding protein